MSMLSGSLSTHELRAWSPFGGWVWGVLGGFTIGCLVWVVGGVGGLLVNCIVVVSIFLFCGFV